MALIYRNVTGPVSGANGDLLATGTMRAKLLSPLVDGTTFVATEVVEESIVAGVFTMPLAATGKYEFTVLTETGDTLWSFQATLGDSSAANISLAELYVQEEVCESCDTTEIFATLLSLLDTPDDLTGQAGKTIVVNGTEDGFEFV